MNIKKLKSIDTFKIDSLNSIESENNMFTYDDSGFCHIPETEDYTPNVETKSESEEETDN